MDNLPLLKINYDAFGGKSEALIRINFMLDLHNKVTSAVTKAVSLSQFRAC